MLRSVFASRRLRLLSPVVVSGALMILLLSRIDISKVIDRWQDVNWLLLAMSIPVLSLMNSSIRAGRLRLILRAQGLRFPFPWLLLIQLQGAFILSFLPGSFSSDIYRSYSIGRKARRHLISFTSVLLERAMGLSALIFVSITSLLIGVYSLDIIIFSDFVSPVIILAGVVIVAALLAFVIIRQRLIGRWQLPLPFWKRLQEVAEQLSILFGNGRALGALALLSLALQLSIVVWYFSVARAMGIDLSLFAFLICVPVIELLISVPISIGGLGVRDAAMVFLLLPFGVSAEEAISLSLLVAFMATLMGIMAGLSFFVRVPAQIDVTGGNIERVPGGHETARP
jgi:glycosyltransferase 2 family protein